MKHYLIISLCFAFQINAMDVKEGIVCEWNAEISAADNSMYEALALGYLRDSGINLKNKFVLDVVSKNGKISHIMANFTGPDGLVMGIDPNKDMILQANKTYKKSQHLSFHQGCPESLEPSAHSFKFNVATLFNYFDLLDDKREVCKKIYGCLNQKGEFLVNVGSGELLDMEVTREIIEDIPLFGTLLSSCGFDSVLERSHPTDDEYKEIFQDAGFDILLFSKKKNEFVFKNTEDFIALKRSIVMSRPEMQSLPWGMAGWVFNKFIAKFLTKLEKNSEGHYIYPLEEILIHARKSDKK